MPFTSSSFWVHWLISNQLCWRYWGFSILTSGVKIGGHIKAALFILPLREKLPNPLFSDLKESRLLDAVLHYFPRSQIWLFNLVEALPKTHWNKPHQKLVMPPTAAEHQPMLDAKWCWQRHCRHTLDKALHCLARPVSQGVRRLRMRSSLSWVGFGLLDSLTWEHVDCLTKAPKIPWLGCFYCCFSSPCWLCSLNVSRECL